MANIRKLNPTDFENNPIGAANTINRIIDEIQRLNSSVDFVDKYVTVVHGVDLDVVADGLRNPLRNVQILDSRPVRLLPVTDDLQDHEIINYSIKIENNQTAKCRFFWNNPDTYDSLEIKLRFSS